MTEKFLWAGVVLLSLVIAPVCAQPGTRLLQTHLPPTQFQHDLEDAIATAAERHRLIVVYLRNDEDPHATRAMDERVWRNPTLAVQIRWHSEAVEIECRQGNIARRLGVQPKECPAVVVARVHGGKLEVLSRMLTIRNPLMTGIRANNRRAFGLQVNEGNIPDIYPGTLKVLQDSDTALQALKARDPVWSELHELKNPKPQPPPEADPLYETGDAGAAAVADPTPLKGTPDIAGMIDVYARLDEAREAAADGDLYLATGFYTWLWEKADKVDPSFRAVKRSVVAHEMRNLALARSTSRDRFRRLKSAYDERLLWITYERLADWFLLNAIVGDENETVAYFDLFINDLDESSMLPESDLIAYRLLAGRGFWDDAYDLGERPAAPVAQLASEVRFKPVVTPVTRRAAHLVSPRAGGRGANMDARERANIEEFRHTFAIDECARLHAACLRAGREEDAWRIAETLILARPEPEVRLALVGVALAAGVTRSRHLELVDEATLGGASHPILRRRVAAALADEAPARSDK